MGRSNTGTYDHPSQLMWALCSPPGAVALPGTDLFEEDIAGVCHVIPPRFRHVFGRPRQPAPHCLGPEDPPTVRALGQRLERRGGHLSQARQCHNQVKQRRLCDTNSLVTDAACRASVLWEVILWSSEKKHVIFTSGTHVVCCFQACISAYS
jgi:hypothetical protein